MARQEGACWHCGAEWATQAKPRRAFRVISSRALTDLQGARAAVGDGPPAMAVAGNGKLRAADRWVDDGGPA
jgi:hypothetical protein